MKIFKASSFKCAFRGILSAVKSERHMKVHVAAMLVVIAAGFFCRLRLWEWIVCILLFGMVISAELINTAIEKLADTVIPWQDERIKFVKDVSAGAVLTVSIAAALIGILIFLPI
ncbi:diacylglycerol kinase family protein [Parasporobacterium paucivorans]|uniref:Diacylglycerol kinase (ATP) n=1 Tax=Parasporobacterium paucivorans DSM 15970 TaxID=1122934 RepID=A0A1M6DG26_9FIRM|nr:diacylglycerol kinase family protein [Parasporobacterium paucivorans]SHI72297.1 diacylglycerol kinase (ATP) [Parasporobacterium paucivorans DSM 15970]